MMIVSTIDTFWANLENSRLLTIRQVAELRAAVQPIDEGETGVQELARLLVERQVLTRWQAGMLLTGRTAFFLGKYKLLDELGRGGMGAVFQAVQSPLGRIVAVKVMAEKLVRDQNAVARFQREIQAVAALDHPNIVAALDADHVQSTHFLVMEYAEGDSLEAIVKHEGRLPISSACEYIRQAALGLHHAFERGMAHRDIKPSNLLVTRSADGQAIVKILDMGLARFTSESREEAELTTTGQVMGTPDYIAPEQARSTKTADIRSDIYSLGCTLFRLLTGRVPFTGDNAIEKITARWTEAPPPLCQYLPEAPPALEAIVLKMMALDPGARFQTPADVATALAPFSSAVWPANAGASTHPTAAARRAPQHEALVADIDPGLNQFLKDLAHDAARGAEMSTGDMHRSPAAVTHVAAPGAPRHPTSRATRQIARQSAGQRRLILGLVGIVAVAAVCIAFVVWRKSGDTTLVVVLSQADREGCILEVDGRQVDLPRSGALVLSGSPGRRTIKLTRAGYLPIEQAWTLLRGASETFHPEWRPTLETGRKLEFSALQKRVSGLASTLKEKPPAIAAVDVAVTEVREDLVDFRRRHNATSESLSAARLMSRLLWPADRLNRANIDAYELTVAGQGDPARVPAELVAVVGDSRLKHWGGINAIVFSPDGSVLASAGDDRAIRLWDSRTGRELKTLLGHTYRVLSLSYNHDGSLLASSSAESLIKLWDTRSGELRATLPGHPNGTNAVTFSPDGETIVSGGGDGNLRIWSTATGALKRSIPVHEKGVFSVAIRGDGRTVATLDAGRSVKLWDFETGKELALLKHSPTKVWSIAFSPTDPYLAIGSANDDSVGLWSLDTGERAKTLGPHSEVTSVSFSRDGSLLATASTAGTVKLWNAADGIEVREMRGHKEQVWSVALNPEGDLAASAGGDGIVRIWDTMTGELQVVPAGSEGMILAVAVSPDGRQLAAGGSDTMARIWDVATLTQLHGLGPHAGAVCGIVYGPDGSLLAAGNTVWEVARELPVFRRPEIRLGYFGLGLDFDRQGRFLAAGSDDRIARIFDLRSGEPLHEMRGHTDGVVTVAISPNGTLIATGSYDNSDSTVKFWDSKSGALLETLEGRGASDLEFSPDGQQLAGALVDHVRIWDVRTHREVCRLQGQGSRIWSLAYSPDGRTLVSVSSDGTICLWNPQAKKMLKTISVCAPGGAIKQVVYLPDGRHVVTANGNGTLYILRLQEWSAKTKSAADRQEL